MPATPHRVNLAWKTVCKIDIIAKIIKSTRKLATHFRNSGTRTNKLKHMRFPAFFAVRWAEFLFNLFNVALRNWRAYVKYFNLQKLNVFTNTWLNYDRLHLLTFLTDVLSLLKSFQKTCQSDSISITDVLRLKTDLITRLENCKTECVPDGWEQLFKEKVVKTGDKYLYGYHLKRTTPRFNRRQVACSFTTNKRLHILNCLILNLNIRLGLDDAL